jgi:hypothetical protein
MQTEIQKAILYKPLIFNEFFIWPGFATRVGQKYILARNSAAA